MTGIEFVTTPETRAGALQAVEAMRELFEYMETRHHHEEFWWADISDLDVLAKKYLPEGADARTDGLVTGLLEALASANGGLLPNPKTWQPWGVVGAMPLPSCAAPASA